MAYTIPSQSNFPTAKQVPDHAILDKFNKQTYLGNQFILPTIGPTLGGTSETPLVLIQNPNGNTKSLFINLRKVSSSAQQVLFKYYANPTIAVAGVETITVRADASGNLNNTYFTFLDAAGAGWLVWYNINSAGVAPVVAGYTNIPVVAATNASSTTIGGDTRAAITTAAPTGITVTGSTSGVILTSTAQKIIVADGAVPTGFTFALTAGLGVASIPANLRTASGNVSSANAYAFGNFIAATDGTLLSTIGCPADYYVTLSDSQLMIIDPGQSFLVTATALVATTLVNSEVSFYEL